MRQNKVQVRRVPLTMLLVVRMLRRVRPKVLKHWRRKVVPHAHSRI